jgi:DNA-binding SARP family transcriptional activator
MLPPLAGDRLDRERRRYRLGAEALRSASVLEFRILGPLEVVDEHGPVPLGGPKQRATLALLLLAPNRVVSVEQLADALYAGAPPVTAVTQVQRQVSELRKALGSAAAIETRSPGYVVRLLSEQLDLSRFERLVEEANGAHARGDRQSEADLLRGALSLWRGSPLADLVYESFAQSSIERLDEIRLAALEQRFDADLSLGRHAQLVAELEQLTREHPVRERLHGQLMLALYRSGRQAEALEVYRKVRETLLHEFGIDPSPVLHELEHAILNQEPSLATEHAAAPRLEPERVLFVLPSKEGSLDALLDVAVPLARLPARELIVARLLADATDLEAAAATLNERRASLEVATRVAAFTTLDRAGDTVRLAETYGAELVLLDVPAGLDEPTLPGDLAELLARCPADVALLAGGAERSIGGGVFIPFAGGEHDWAALELGAWLASAIGAPVRLAGTDAGRRDGRRDASRLLADASLAVQRVIGVEIEPLLLAADEQALVRATDGSRMIVVGISPRWRNEGIGSTRRALIRSAQPSTLLVHRGPKPGGLAPRETRTRFTWSIAS